MPSPVHPSQALRRLLETHLDTFEKLELVLVLRDSPTPLSVVDVALELQTGEDVLRRLAGTVAHTGLVEVLPDDRLRLVASGEVLDVIAEAAYLFQHQRGLIVTLYSTIAMDKIRGMAARTFADAFQLRKKKDDDNG